MINDIIIWYSFEFKRNCGVIIYYCLFIVFFNCIFDYYYYIKLVCLLIWYVLVWINVYSVMKYIKCYL